MANKVSVVDANSWHIADNPSIYEPARNNNFEFLVMGVDNLLKAGVLESEAEGDESAYLSDGQEIIRLSVNKAPVPHVSQSEISISRGNVWYRSSIFPTRTRTLPCPRPFSPRTSPFRPRTFDDTIPESLPIRPFEAVF